MRKPSGLFWSGVLLATLIGCGDTEKKPPSLVGLSIEPAELTVTVVDGKAIAQGYTVWVTDSNGKVDDVTELAHLSLADDRYGTLDGATLTITGLGAGKTKLLATLETVSAESELTVYVKKRILDPDVPPTTPTDFDTATEDAALAPSIVYPSDKILVPPNIGTFDVHWRTDASSLFELRMANEYVDVRRYTKGTVAAAAAYWSQFQISEWSPVASTKQQLHLSVAGMSPTAPGKKGSSAQQLVDVTNENTRGGIYYWSTTNPATILRYDVEKPNTAPSRMFAVNQVPDTGTATGNACHGCHALSKDGTKLAMTLDGGNGRGTAVTVATRAVTIPVDNATRWNFATFSPDSAKLLTVYQGIMSIRDTAGGAVRGTLANSAGKYATHPEISPDGSKLVNAECTGGYEAVASGCNLVIRPLDLANNSAGAIQVLVPAEAGRDTYYPSFSPDGQWVAYTRSAGGTYNIASAETWIIRADGTGAPIKLAAADKDQVNRTNSWARWVPFGQTFGPANEPMFYLTFSSMRPFGVRLPQGGVPQIWMTPIFPSRAAAGQDPSGPAFRVPFQDVATGNHIAQWTQTVVPIE